MMKPPMTPRRARRLVCRLHDAGVRVVVTNGERARLGFEIGDDASLKPAVAALLVRAWDVGGELRDAIREAVERNCRKSPRPRPAAADVGPDDGAATSLVVAAMPLPGR